MPQFIALEISGYDVIMIWQGELLADHSRLSGLQVFKV